MPAYNKLVRNNIPRIIAGRGDSVLKHTLTLPEFRTALAAKAVEEALELQQAHAQYRNAQSRQDRPAMKLAKAKIAEEEGDLQQVLRELRRVVDIRPLEVEAARRSKARKNGTFSDRIFLESSMP